MIGGKPGLHFRDRAGHGDEAILCVDLFIRFRRRFGQVVNKKLSMECKKEELRAGHAPYPLVELPQNGRGAIVGFRKHHNRITIHEEDRVRAYLRCECLPISLV